MPFHALFEAEYERVIRPAIEEAGLRCVRGDEIYTQQAIIDDIWQSIRQARLADRGQLYVRAAGSARSYGLDSFELAISDDGQAMPGQALLRHGRREVVFKRLSKPPALQI